MSTPEQILKDMKKIMLRTTVQSIVITAGVVALVLVLAHFLNYEINASPFTVTLLIVGALMAFIGNNFVAHATTRFDATKSILWIWGNRVQAVGFIIVLAVAFL